MKTKGLIFSCMLVIVLAGNAGAASVSVDVTAWSNLFLTDYYDPSLPGWNSTVFQSDMKGTPISSSTLISQTFDTKAFSVVTEIRDTEDGPKDFLFSVGATSRISARAGFGNLGIALYGGAQNAPMSYYYIDPDGLYQAAETTASAHGGATGAVTWHDTLTVLSPTLPPGSAVKLLATGTLTGSVSASSTGFETYGRFGADFPWMGSILSTDPVPTKTAVVTLTVGNTYSIAGDLGASGDAFAGWNPWRLVDSNVWHAEDASVSVNVMDTASFHLDVVTPDVYYTTGSGTDYRTAAAVPEPSTLLLLGGGLAGLAMVRRFRKQIPSLYS